jgi:molybdopterin-guanine dinucleotide biosynthesis protein B
MPAVLSVVGKSKVGKTTFLEKLIPEMLRRGYRVGTIKHDVHDNFDIDHAGKDTWRHREAGAQTVAISSPSRFALTKRVAEELDLDSIVASYFHDEDLVLTEGYKSTNKAKIEICRSERGLEPLCSQADGLVAVASDFPMEIGVPCFDLENVSEIANFLEERFLDTIPRPNLVLRIDGRKLPIKSFVREFLMGGILGMIATLRGYGDPARVDISIRLKRPQRSL